MATLTLGVGYELIYECPQPTPMMLMLHIHHTRAADIIEPDLMQADPFIPTVPYRDGFGNWCTRILAPAGRLRLSARAILRDSGEPDPVAVAGEQHPVEELRTSSCISLGSAIADRPPHGNSVGPVRSRSVRCRPRPGHLRLRPPSHHVQLSGRALHADGVGRLQERRGVCRDFAHLAVTLCRCMNIPARYCTGYLTDIGVEPPYGPMDFAAWFEAYIGGRWHTFDARNNTPRIGRVLMARGRDATDVAISNTFGPNTRRVFGGLTRRRKRGGIWLAAA